MAAILSALAAIGCGSQTETGSAHISVDTKALIVDVMKIKLTVSAADMATMTTELTQAQNNVQWDGQVDEIPAGVGRTFTAEASDSTSAVIYAVTVNDVTITRGVKTVVLITLQEVNPHPGPENDSPIISGISLSSDNVVPGAVVNLSVTAGDPNSADTIYYLWDAECVPAGSGPNPNGAFSAINIAGPTWTAPAYPDGVAALCTLSIKVADSSNASVKTFFNIQVSGGIGQASLTSTRPLISTLKADLGYRDGLQTWDFSVCAHDPDGGKLAYEWSSPNCNTGDAGWNMSAPYTLTTPRFTYTNSTTDCRFTVLVTELCTAQHCAAPLGAAGGSHDQAIGVIYGHLPAEAQVAL